MTIFKFLTTKTRFYASVNYQQWLLGVVVGRSFTSMNWILSLHIGPVVLTWFTAQRDLL